MQINFYDQAIQIDSNPKAYSGKGKALLKLNRISEANACFDILNKLSIT